MHWYSWGGCEAQTSESKMPNRRSQLRSGLQLQPSICQSYSQCTTLQNSKWESFDIPTMRCNGQDNVTNIIMDLKKKKTFLYHPPTEVSKIEEVDNWMHFGLCFFPSANAPKNNSIHISQAFPFKHYNLPLPLILMMMMNFNYPRRVQSVVHEQSCAIDNPKCVKWFQIWEPLRQSPQTFTFSNP